MSSPPAQARHPVDEYRPVRKLGVLGLQHVLVMAASPISSVFLISQTLGLSADLSARLLAVAFVLSGLGTILQSGGLWAFGPRLPFVMLPGGAPVVLFIAIAKEEGLRTATGAVLIAAAFYFLVLPVFGRLLRFFPAVVIGTMIVIIGVNLLRFSALLITGRPGSAEFGDPLNIALGLGTIGLIVLFFRVLRGMARQLAVLLGLVCGAVLGGIVGEFHIEGLGGDIVHPPALFPFGTPQFDLLAALPLMIFTVAAMAEATGQTVLNAEIVGKEIDKRREVSRTIRGDGLISLIGGLFGTSLMVTSGENIGIVRVSGVRSRFVTLTAGVLLILIGLLSPITHVINAIPAAVIGGTAMAVYAVITVLGIQMLREVDMSDHANMVICAAALSIGLLPILVPGAYDQLPANVRTLLGSGVAMGTLVAVLLNVLFMHLRKPPDTPADGKGTAEHAS